ncbi:DNA polymerase III subunit alpha [Basilea psittacipulmonis]|uniref:DNA polymerase III subunit alpha n=1 Tax=Basilea psittacipulmonis DSM 24701 TaxID=1072685 RepID=A0A077DDU1_9BURK|nr:DNA polymerase III subunit alpha [Basilea psittacipulmonis]AIL32779.1 DNA polymerase III subunit alpha [Basilea psittacipulmonis DSM 24701]
MFVHLRLHSEYSIVDGIVNIPHLIKKLESFEQPAIALSDQMNLFGFIKLYKAARKAGIKPIVACDLIVENEEDLANPHRLLAIAKNKEGYHSLCELISQAWLNNVRKDHAEICKEWLKKYRGLILLSGGKHGEIGHLLMSGKYEQAKTLALAWKKEFGDDFYIELQRAGFDDDEVYVQAACQLASETDIPVVATHPVQFLEKEEFTSHEIKYCILGSYLLADPKRERCFIPEQYLKSTEEMKALFHDIPSAIDNTIEIAKRCNVTIELGNPQLPIFPTPNGETLDDYLRTLSMQGLEKRLIQLYPDEKERNEKRPVYVERLNNECDVIIKMKFPGYFLIVQDFINWAKNNQVPVGPGRGSGAGSLVAYSLGITDLDPLKYDLLFERFLNPERVSMPDFDVDFCKANRDRVIEYVKERYGRDAVSQIATFGTLGAKAVVRDVGRVLDLPYSLCDYVSKIIPQDPANPWSLERALKELPEFKRMYEQDEQIKSLVDASIPLEGLTRNVGMHAGGVLIAPGKLTDFCPLYCQPGHDDSVISQYDKGDVEDVGLVKFDFLGLRNLTILEWAVAYIKAFNPAAKDFDLLSIPVDDKATFDLLSSGNTTAVFQLESRGMKKLLKELQPSTFEDIIAVCALFRPGPLDSGMVTDFVNRKHGRAEIDYFHKDLESTLSSTYGVIVYQEQVMLISQIIGGYSLGGADLLRRAMGKKKPEEMAKQREIFQEGAVKKGYDRDLAVKLFDLMEKFAGYGFNKSHSAAYALLAWQTAWMKVHYPAEFMAATISSEMDSTDSMQNFIVDSIANGLRILPVDINESDYMFKPVEDEFTKKGLSPRTIRYGLGAIKGAGEGAMEYIVAERKKNGPYKDLYDFCCRLDKQVMNRRMIENLVKAGAFDSIDPNRAAVLASVSSCLEAAVQSHQNSMQDSLFPDDSHMVVHNMVKDHRPWTMKELLEHEKIVLGFHFSYHLFDIWRDEIRRVIPTSLQKLNKPMSSVMIAGVIEDIRVFPKKDGNGHVYILILNDGTQTIEASIKEDLYLMNKEILQKESLLIANVKVSEYNGTIRVAIMSLMTLEALRNEYARYLTVEIHDTKQLDSFKKWAKKHPGHLPVSVQVSHQDFVCELSLNGFKASISEPALEQLHNSGLVYKINYI